MCAVSRWVPSCYVMCLTVQRDVSCEQIIPIMLDSVIDCREMCPVSRWVPSCYVMCLTSERCVLRADESHHAVQCVWLQRDVCCEQLSAIMLCNVFDCREMRAVSRWVPSSYVMCLTVQRDFCCEQMSPIMLCNVFDCREMCAVSRWVLSCYVMCLCREICVVSRSFTSCYVMCLTTQRCVLWADESHQAM